MLLTGLLALCTVDVAHSQKYFQQKADYAISVTLNDRNNTLHGEAKINYVNHSPDTLHEIWFHLWPNAYRDRSTAMARQMRDNGSADFHFVKTEDRGRIDSLKFSVDGSETFWSFDQDNIDLARVRIPGGVYPGDSVLISTPFLVKIPVDGISRLGHYNQNFHITQWYPKPAVYDRNGWQAFPYLDHGEFYSEYGSFDVSITLPANYLVAATGFTKAHLDVCRDVARMSGRDISEHQVKIPASSAEMRTWNFSTDQVHDFAWFASKTYSVRPSAVRLPSGKEVLTAVFYAPEYCYECDKAIAFVDTAIQRYTGMIGEYPYNAALVVYSGDGGGMEYPGVTRIGPSSDPEFLRETTYHELCHNWFYAAIGSNERKNAWMDEGMTTYFTHLLMEEQLPGQSLLQRYLSMDKPRIAKLHKTPAELLFYFSFLFASSRDLDLPASLSAEQYSRSNYYNMTYMKAAMAFRLLHHTLGDSLFYAGVRSYYYEWNGRHPGPADMQQSFEKTCRCDLSWLFAGVISSREKSDYALRSVKKATKEDSVYSIIVKNKNRLPLPYELTLYSEGTDTVILTSPGHTGQDTLYTTKKFKRLVIDQQLLLPEQQRSNNSMRAKGILKKLKIPLFAPLWSLPADTRERILFLPAAGWNSSDGLMAGITFYSDPVFPKRLDYVLMPLYATATKSLSGFGEAGFSFHSDSRWLRTIRVYGQYRRYGIHDAPVLKMRKAETGLEFNFRRRDNSRYAALIRLRNAWIQKDELQYLYSHQSMQREAVLIPLQYRLGELMMQFRVEGPVNPSVITLRIRESNYFMNLSLDAATRLSYARKNKGFSARIFAGGFIYSNNAPFDARFRLSAPAAFQDYFFDGVYPGRGSYSGFFSQQMTFSDGGFSLYTAYGQSWKWLTTLNLKASFPGRIPLDAALNLGTFAEAGKIQSLKEKLFTKWSLFCR
jgi:hypothetical protein